MLKRFSLYGFLKNQRYFEPFFVLLMLDRELSFTAIGGLIAYREILVNGLEIPSGAAADRWGRRRSMIASFSAYVLSFVLFAVAHTIPGFVAAMSLFAVGEAFRTGTHKAMIFSWLAQQNRLDERTQVYGYTRSWSKIGSALSALIAAAIVLVTDGYNYVFLLAIIPYSLAIVNFLGYPASLDLELAKDARQSSLLRQLRESLVVASTNKPLRGLILQATAFEGSFAATKDYLQPLLLAAATSSLGTMAPSKGLSATQNTALLVGPVFSVLFLVAAFSSRNAHRLVGRCGSEERAGDLLWISAIAIYALILVGAMLDLASLAIVGFIVLYASQNLWRPILITRFDRASDSRQAATLLSVESQAKRIGTAILAPLLGFVVDWTSGAPSHIGRFWPVGALGLFIAVVGWTMGRTQSSRSEDTGSTPLAL